MEVVYLFIYFTPNLAHFFASSKEAISIDLKKMLALQILWCKIFYIEFLVVYNHQKNILPLSISKSMLLRAGTVQTTS